MSLAYPNLVTRVVDTGTDCSLLKLSGANGDEFLNTGIKHQLKGITNETLNTVAICQGKGFINYLELEHSFHLVKDDFPISCV